MFIDFQGYRLSHKQEEMIRSAVSLSLDYLISQRLKRTLEISVTIEKDLYEDRRIWGDMSPEDDERSPKLFEMRLNYSGVQSFGQLIKALSHETIHIAQFATRRLRHLSGSFRVRFEKDIYVSSHVRYEDRPWEIEAHDLEDKILDYIRSSDPEIENYIQSKACDVWRPESTFLASEL
jgi:hypothetical protein